MKEKAAKEIKDRSRQWFLDALFALMEKQEYNTISISDLCRQADLTRQTFYRHFSSKDDLIISYFMQLFSSLYGEIEAQEKLSLEELLSIYLHFWEKHRDFVELLNKCNNSNNTLNCNLKFIQRCYPRLDLPTIIHQETAENFIAGGLYSCLEQWIASGYSLSADELVQYMMQLLSLS